MKFIACLLLIVMCRCTQNTPADNSSLQNGNQAKPALTTPPDSVEILYFKDPYGDPKRYTRYFTFNTVKEKQFTAQVSGFLDSNYIKQDTVKNCRSEGKMILHYPREVYKILYFATKCDTCCYVYRIDNGVFLYYNLPDSLRGYLLKNKAYARDPG